MDFDDIMIAFDDRVIEPRLWTVAQSRWARELLEQAPPGPVLELCSGAGHIGLRAVLGLDRPLIQVDINPVACEYATRNAHRAGLSGQVRVRCGPMDGVLDPAERFALVIADPPYLPTASIDRFPEDPALAIDGGTDGFALVAGCIDVIATHLVTAGMAVLQVASVAQAAAVEQHLRDRPELGLTQTIVRDCGRGALSLLQRT